MIELFQRLFSKAQKNNCTKLLPKPWGSWLVLFEEKIQTRKSRVDNSLISPLRSPQKEQLYNLAEQKLCHTWWLQHFHERSKKTSVAVAIGGEDFKKDVINTVIDLFFTAGDFSRQISFIFYKVSYLCNIPLGVFKNQIVVVLPRFKSGFQRRTTTDTYLSSRRFWLILRLRVKSHNPLYPNISTHIISILFSIHFL